MYRMLIKLIAHLETAMNTCTRHLVITFDTFQMSSVIYKYKNFCTYHVALRCENAFLSCKLISIKSKLVFSTLCKFHSTIGLFNRSEKG